MKYKPLSVFIKKPYIIKFVKKFLIFFIFQVLAELGLEENVKESTATGIDPVLTISEDSEVPPAILPLKAFPLETEAFQVRPAMQPVKVLTLEVRILI